MKTNETNHAVITDLSSVVLANVTTRRGGGTQKCDQTAYEVARDNGADQDRIRVSFTYLKDDSITHARSIISKLVRELTKFTLPCPSFKGAKYVKAVDMERVQSMVDKADAELYAAKRDIIDHWDTIVTNAKTAASRMADTNDIEWPTADDYADTLAIELEWLASPAPVKDTVLETISDEVASRARASQASDKMFLKAHAAPVREVLTALAKAANATRESTKKGKRLRQANFDNLAEAIENVRQFNWLNVPELNALADSLQSRGIIAPDAPSLQSGERYALANKLDEATSAAADTLADLGI